MTDLKAIRELVADARAAAASPGNDGERLEGFADRLEALLTGAEEGVVAWRVRVRYEQGVGPWCYHEAPEAEVRGAFNGPNFDIEPVYASPALAAREGVDDRDAEWTLAIAHAVGLTSGLDVPLVPDAAEFRKLFAALRASRPLSGEGKP